MSSKKADPSEKTDILPEHLSGTGKPSTLGDIRRTLLISTQSAIADHLLQRGEALYITDLQRPSQRRDRADGWNRLEPLHPLRQKRISAQGANQGAFGLLRSFQSLPAQFQQRP